MDIETVEREPARYAYLRHSGPYPEIGATFGKLAAIAGGAGLLAKPGALFVGVYHDDPMTTPAEALRSDAGITLSDGDTPPGLEKATLAGGPYAKGVHKGSYSKMGDSWMAFYDAIHRSGRNIRGTPPFELYISDMQTTPEDELITELYVAVE